MSCSADEVSRAVPSWARLVLLASCIHSAVWGICIMALPEASALFYGFETPPADMHLWQGSGLFISLLAFGYWLAAEDVRQHWGLVLIGLLAKFAGALGMCSAVWRGHVSAQVLWLLPFNDIIWWWPFWRIVTSARGDRQSTSAQAP